MTPHRPRLPGGSGHSLAETLLVVALIGVTAVALAPFQTFLMRRLHNPKVAARPVALFWAARQLAADARAALDTRVDSPSSVRFTLPRGRRVAWRAMPEGTVHRVGESDEGGIHRTVAGTTLDVALPAENLLSGTLTGPDGRTHRVEIWLRHGERR